MYEVPSRLAQKPGGRAQQKRWLWEDLADICP